MQGSGGFLTYSSQTTTVGDVLRLHSRHRPGDRALITERVRQTYAELNRSANVAASALSAHGIVPGDRVAVLARNSAEYVHLFYAAAKLGAMLVPMNFWHRTEEHRYIVDNAEPAIVFHEPAYAEMVAGVVPAGVPRVQVAPSLPDATDDPSWSEFLASATSEDEPGIEVDPASPHLMLYTSGTTGRPKGAALPHVRTLHGAHAMVGGIRVRQDDLFMNFYPAFHAGNWDNMMIYAVAGAAQVLVRQYDAGEVISVMEREGATVVCMVPTMLRGVLEHPDFDRERLRSLRLMTYAAYDPTGLMRECATLFGAERGEIEMLQTYGFSESTPWITLCPPEYLFTHWGSVGRPLPGIDIALLDPEGNEVPTGGTGEICVRAPSMTGYWGLPEETATAARDGWLHSGDVGAYDDDGFLYVVDRVKDVVRSGGHNVYSREVEACLEQHPDVAEVAVIGVPDRELDEAVCAVVVPRQEPEDRDAFAASLQAYVRERSAGYNVPRHVRFVREIPRNATGKAIKKELRNLFGSVFDQGQAGAAVGPAPAAQQDAP